MARIKPTWNGEFLDVQKSFRCSYPGVQYRMCIIKAMMLLFMYRVSHIFIFCISSKSSVFISYDYFLHVCCYWVTAISLQICNHESPRCNLAYFIEILFFLHVKNEKDESFGNA